MFFRHGLEKTSLEVQKSRVVLAERHITFLVTLLPPLAFIPLAYLDCKVSGGGTRSHSLRQSSPNVDWGLWAVL